MDNVTEPWLLEPETIRKLKEMRAEIRKEIGKTTHFSDRDGIIEIVSLCSQSKNPQLKTWAGDIKARLEENV